MKLDDKVKRHNNIHSLISERNKHIEKARTIQEKIDRAKGINGKPQPRTYDSLRGMLKNNYNYKEEAE